MGLLRAKVAVGQTAIGGYQVLEKIGRGATGTVYKARHPSNGEVVAIKLISGEVAKDEVQRLRFAQECQITRQLNHPNIVRVLDFGLEGDKAYMIMEFVDGESLGDRLERDGAMREAEALRLIHQVGQALHTAHQRKLIHRDIKPDNVLVSVDGVAKLMDLGLVKNLEGGFDLTRTKMCLGTPNFMAPEQFEEAKKADVRSDVYALAATLYNMVTGELPFRARTANAVATVYKKQRANDITPPRDVVPSLSIEIDAAILRGMRAKPSERFASVEEFLAALKPYEDPLAAADLPPLPELDLPVSASEENVPTEVDLRAKKRFPCERTTSCRAMQWSPGENWFGKVLNLSESGLCLQLSRRFEPGAILTVVLDSQTSRRRSVLVRVVWVEQVSKKSWKMGCHYDQPLCDFEVKEMMS